MIIAMSRQVIREPHRPAFICLQIAQVVHELRAAQGMVDPPDGHRQQAGHVVTIEKDISVIIGHGIQKFHEGPENSFSPCARPALEIVVRKFPVI